jgi:hypothetical protein
VKVLQYVEWELPKEVVFRVSDLLENAVF